MGTDTAPTKDSLLSGRMCASSDPLHPVCVCVCVRSLNAYFPYKTGCQSPMFAAAEVCQGQVQVFNWTAVGG